MKRKRHQEEQIIRILREAEGGEKSTSAEPRTPSRSQSNGESFPLRIGMPDNNIRA